MAPRRGRLDRVERRVGDGVGADDRDPVQHDLVGGHVEADQGHDHLADRGGRSSAGEETLARTPSIAPLQAVAGDVELAAALPEADQEPRRGLLAGQLADLHERLQAPQLRDVPGDELARQRRVLVHRQRPLPRGRLEVERQLRPRRQQLLEQVGGLHGQPPERILEPLARALQSGHASRIRLRGRASCACTAPCRCTTSPQRPERGRRPDKQELLDDQRAAGLAIGALAAFGRCESERLAAVLPI